MRSWPRHTGSVAGSVKPEMAIFVSSDHAGCPLCAGRGIGRGPVCDPPDVPRSRPWPAPCCRPPSCAPRRSRARGLHRPCYQRSAPLAPRAPPQPRSQFAVAEDRVSGRHAVAFSAAGPWPRPCRCARPPRGRDRGGRSAGCGPPARAPGREGNGKPGGGSSTAGPRGRPWSSPGDEPAQPDAARIGEREHAAAGQGDARPRGFTGKWTTGGSSGSSFTSRCGGAVSGEDEQDRRTGRADHRVEHLSKATRDGPVGRALDGLMRAGPPPVPRPRAAAARGVRHG